MTTEPSTDPPRISVVILTHNRADELAVTLERMCALPLRPPIIVVDNASTDATAALVRERFPQVALIRLERNLGAAARNLGVRQAATPYVAFSDDDSWWQPGSLERACALLDAHPRVAAVCARILLGADEHEDPVCAEMARSPLPRARLPGPALLGFVACAVAFRRQAYLDAGGYERRFFVGGEEELLALDLVTQGWSIVYAAHLTVHHHPSPRRDNADRQRVVVRNMLWVAWLRLPLAHALGQTWRICRGAPSRRAMAAGLASALRALRWVLRRRQVVRPEVLGMYLTLRAG